MELLTQQGWCLPGRMRTCIVVQQNNSTRERTSSVSNLRSHLPAENEQHFVPRSRRDSQSAHPWPQLSMHLPRDKVRRTTAWGPFQHHTEHQKQIIGCHKTGAWTVCTNVVYFPDGLRTSKQSLDNFFIILIPAKFLCYWLHIYIRMKIMIMLKYSLANENLKFTRISL